MPAGNARFTGGFRSRVDDRRQAAGRGVRRLPAAARHGRRAGERRRQIMKRTLLALALCAAAGFAAADEDDTVLAPVIVEGVDGYRIVEDCTPPADAPMCTGFHALIRANFNEREIGMLFGAATSYPEYRTSYSMVKDRYDDLVNYVED